jgi:hypothetical protein
MEEQRDINEQNQLQMVVHVGLLGFNASIFNSEMETLCPAGTPVCVQE